MTWLPESVREVLAGRGSTAAPLKSRQEVSTPLRLWLRIKEEKISKKKDQGPFR